MQRWQVGKVSITRVIEIEDTSMGAPALVPEAKPAAVLPIGWLRPHFVDDSGNLISSIHSLLVLSEGRRIVIDTCLGNDKPRIVPQWNRRQGRFLEELAAAGFPRESVDYVVCTHLHPDHVGWNTMLVDGRWVPTFPNARYIFSARDWEWLDKAPVTALGDYSGDSVRPVIDAGLADLVDPGFRFTDEVWLESTPGHSPGHVSVRISSGGEQAIVTGDLMHHPCQLAFPHWSNPFDFDRAQALATRRAFIERYSGTAVLVIGSHFATPSAGRIVRDGDAWRLAV
ncbi:MAG: MBL fold metallo-hydrolase [Gammaproteobacteria bacterium]|nr:MBL fold metallo-hydrolase [Gammaproteobacteria bacterium]